MFGLLTVLFVAVRLSSAGRLLAGGGVLAVYGVVQVLASLWGLLSLRGGVRSSGAVSWGVPLLYTSPMWFWCLPAYAGSAVSSTGLLVAFALEGWALLSIRSSFTLAGPVFRRVVDGGPYRLIRHPQYLAFLLIVWVTSAGFDWPMKALYLIVQVLACAKVIDLEERFLWQFGEYREYCSRVRWLLVPGVA